MLVNYKPSRSRANVNAPLLIKRLAAPLQQTPLRGARRAEETRKTPPSLWKQCCGSWLVFAFVCVAWKIKFCQSQVLSLAVCLSSTNQNPDGPSNTMTMLLAPLSAGHWLYEKQSFYLTQKKISFIFFPMMYDTGTTWANVVTLKWGCTAAIMVLESLELWPYRVWMLLFLKCESYNINTSCFRSIFSHMAEKLSFWSLFF